MVLCVRPPWTAQFWSAWTRNKSDGQTESTAPTEAGACQNVRIQDKILSYYNNFNAVFVAAAEAAACQPIHIL
jgi:hypothetical protein